MPSYTDTLYGNQPTPSYTSQLQAPSYQPQTSGYQDTSQALNAGGDAGVSSGNPYAAYAGMGLKAIGTGFDIYGKYQAREDARAEQDRAMREYEKMKLIEQQDRNRELERQQRQESYFGAEYSQGLEDRFAGSYGGYRQGGQ